MKMQKAYAAAAEYMEDNDLQPTGFGWEEFVSDPMEVEEKSVVIIPR